MLLEKGFEHYRKNIKVALLFAIPVALIALLMPLAEKEVIFGSGTAYISFWQKSSAIALAIGATFLLVQAFFVALITLAVVRELSKIDIERFFRERLVHAAFRIGIFYIGFAALAFLALLICQYNALLLIFCIGMLAIISLATMYVPQAIIVDELPVSYAIAESTSIVKRNFKESLSIAVLACCVIAAIALLETLLENALEPSILIEVVFLLALNMFAIPFFEVLKTYNYMMKFDLIKAIERVK